jgi:hypothetical protein
MSDSSDDMEFYSGMCEEEEDIEELLDIAIKALKEINIVELNSQRPGGRYSLSARISYQALLTLGEYE